MLFSDERINDAGRILNDKSQTLSSRFRALFLLRNTNDDRSVDLICKCFSDSSALLKHELAYCLGQMQNPTAICCLLSVLEDKEQEPMVRHEAGEALAAIGDPENKFDIKKVLMRYSNDPIKEVAETCQLALQMIKWRDENGQNPRSAYNSIDPAPAAKTYNMTSVDDLGKVLINSEKKFERR